MDTTTIFAQVCSAISSIPSIDSRDDRIALINRIKLELRNYSDFKNEPVDCVIWVKSDDVVANDYNPNSVAPPEMELLKTSIEQDGYTQPIVTWRTEDKYQVVDGFHRNRVGKECDSVKNRINGYLPVVAINEDRVDLPDRIASTIRHNRARGKHAIDAMSDIVIELKKRNWSNEKISKNLGMDSDEVLRLCQITGLAEVFSNHEFSQAWESEIFKDEDFSIITEDDIKSDDGKGDRILHTYDKWECFKNGFYSDKAPLDMTTEQCEIAYMNFLSNLELFEVALNRVISEWKNSCEHYLTNDKMNRIAWLGQASACISMGIPAKFKGGYNMLSNDQKLAADNMALKYLNKWMASNGRKEIASLDDARSKTEANLY